LVVSDPAVANSSCVLTRRSVLNCSHENLHGILASAKVDYFKCAFDEVEGSGFLTSVLPWPHQVIHEPFNNVQSGFMELSVRVSSHSVRYMNWGERYVSLKPWIF